MDELERLKKYVEQLIQEENNKSIPDFEGYSPIEMSHILDHPFDNNSPIQLIETGEVDYNNMPLLSQIKHLLQIVEENGELKLTAKGFLPTKVVAEIYHQGFIKNQFIELGISKLYKETDALGVHLTRLIAELSGLVKKRHKKMSLTKKGKVELNDNFKLFKSIFTAYTTKFNWAYNDGFGENDIGQLGFGFSLILLNKYGSEKQRNHFYTEKYFKAFPKLLELNEQSGNDSSYRCYSVRTFDRFLEYFGFIKIVKKSPWDSINSIEKTDRFDKLIKIIPPKADL